MGRIPWKRKWSNHTIFERSRRVGKDSRRAASQRAPLKSYSASKFEKRGPAPPCIIIDRRWRCQSHFRNSLPWCLAIAVQGSRVLVLAFIVWGGIFAVRQPPWVASITFLWLWHVLDCQVVTFFVKSRKINALTPHRFCDVFSCAKCICFSDLDATQSNPGWRS